MRYRWNPVKLIENLRPWVFMAGVVIIAAAGGGTGDEIFACAVPGLALIGLAGKNHI